MTLNITITDFLVNLKNGIVHLLPFMFKKKEQRTHNIVCNSKLKHKRKVHQLKHNNLTG